MRIFLWVFHPGTIQTSGDQPALPHTAAAGEESSSSDRQAPPPSPKHLNHLQTVTLRCKASTKRKVRSSAGRKTRFHPQVTVITRVCLQVEQMEVDDFYDGIKRLYNEDVTAAVHEGAAGGEGVFVGGSSPCPPLQPVSSS